MWRDAYLEARVLSAEPLELICLLYQHAVDAVRDAQGHLASGDVVARTRAISKAVAILSELTNSLDHRAGAISENLEQLYHYMSMRLTEANLRKEAAPLREVESLLTTLAEAWKQAQTAQPQEAAVPVNAPVETWQNPGEGSVAWSA